MICPDRCHSGGEPVSNYLMLWDGRGHGDHNDHQGAVSRMRVTGTIAGRADAIGSVIARRLDRDLLVEES
jgi:hypothetical protein